MNIDQCQNEEDYPNPFVDETKEKETHTKESLGEVFAANNKIKVIFTKKDGSERTMLCTKNHGTIPKEYRSTDQKQTDRPGKPTPDHLFSVFDLEANGWRSFTIGNVISIGHVE